MSTAPKTDSYRFSVACQGFGPRVDPVASRNAVRAVRVTSVDTAIVAMKPKTSTA